jgi:hypothetical protein
MRNDEVVHMIRHKRVGQQLRTKSHRTFGEQFKVYSAVPRGEKHILPTNTSLGYVVRDMRDDYSTSSCHIY